MKKIDLHEEFVRALCSKVPKKSDLVNLVSDILSIEKEPASRRLNGRVLFTVREMGILASAFHISLDELLHKEKEYFSIPLYLNSPMKIRSMDSLCDRLDYTLDALRKVLQKPAELGSVYNVLPVEFFVFYPTIMKFMFFKWGHYFIGTEEFDNFSRWKLPGRLSNLKERYQQLGNIKTLYYIWDGSLIRSLIGEIRNFYKMHVIKTGEIEVLKNELKDLLLKLEDYLKGIPVSGTFQEIENFQFYISNLNLGFSCTYGVSGSDFIAHYESFFASAKLDHTYQHVEKLIDWVKSLRSISLLISDSARIERRLFFEEQHRIVDEILS